jgi:hypothetical protein
MATSLTLEQLAAKLSANPSLAEQRAIKRNVQSLLAQGAWNAESALRDQERAYKKSRRYESFKADNGISDSFNFSPPKRRRATTRQRKVLDYATVAIKYTLKENVQYPFPEPIAFYVNEYAAKRMSDEQWDTIMQLLKSACV